MAYAPAHDPTSRFRLPVMAVLFGAFTSAMTAVALSYSPTPTSAQERAERACFEQGVRPETQAWELCLSHVTRAFEWNEQSLAQQLARASGDAVQSCLGYGLQPQSAAYHACLSREIDARSEPQILGDDDTGRNLAHQPINSLVREQ